MFEFSAMSSAQILYKFFLVVFFANFERFYSIIFD